MRVNAEVLRHQEGGHDKCYIVAWSLDREFNVSAWGRWGSPTFQNKLQANYYALERLIESKMAKGYEIVSRHSMVEVPDDESPSDVIRRFMPLSTTRVTSHLRDLAKINELLSSDEPPPPPRVPRKQAPRTVQPKVQVERVLDPLAALDL